MQTFAKIKTVRSLPLNTGVERQFITAKRFGLGLKPIEHRRARALRAAGFVADQIVDVQTATDRGIFYLSLIHI